MSLTSHRRTRLKARLTTAGVPASEATAFWERHLDGIGLGGRISCDRSAGYSASLEVYDFGVGEFYSLKRDASRYLRTASDCVATPSDAFILGYTRQGVARVRQGGCETTVGVGEAVMVYSGEAMVSEHHDSVVTAIRMPSAWVRRWIGAPIEAAATAFTAATPWGKALCATLDALTPEFLPDLTLPPDALNDQIGSLLALALGPRRVRLGTYRAGLLRRLMQAIRARASDLSYAPGVCAAEHGISTRTLYATFAEADTSFSRELRKSRMAIAAAILASTTYRKLRIAEVAAMSGYADPNYFISVFRKFHGIPPSEYRRRHL